MHTKNILADPRVSLMLDERKAGDPLEGARVMLMGAAAVTDDAEARRRYLLRQPEAEMFVGFKDFSFYQVTLKRAHLVAGFGRIVNLGADQLITDVSECGDLLAAEESAIDHMNEEHGEALRLYATRLLDVPDRDWRMTGADPDGIDLRAGTLRARLDFPKRAKTGQELREALIALARAARGAGTERAAE